MIKSKDIEVIFLGTNGWYDSVTGNTLCILIKTRDFNIVLDAGSGIYKLDRYMEKNKPVYLFLSHFHLDHIIGLHALEKFNFEKGLTIIGKRGIKKILNTIIDVPYSMPFDMMKNAVVIREFNNMKTSLPFSAEALPLLHSVYCLGYRITINGKVIAFCTDTGYCANAVKLADGADLLISECAELPGEYDESWPHLNPKSAAKIAKEANAKMLALAHFDSKRYDEIGKRKKAASVSRGIFKNTVYTTDGMIIKL